jgi:hypothetical protein
MLTECITLNFVEAIALYRSVSKVHFRCQGNASKISLVDNENKGYFLKIRKCTTRNCCAYCCLKECSKISNILVSEDGNYLTIHSC